jgi:hypothetical protein
LILNLNHEEYNNSEEAEHFDDELFGMIRIIISNYNGETKDFKVFNIFCCPDLFTSNIYIKTGYLLNPLISNILNHHWVKVFE